MMIRIEGTAKVVKDLKKEEELIKEAQSIIYRLPTEITMEIQEDGKEA